MSATLRNILIVARREFLVRARTRAYRITTVLLVLVGIAVALAPIGIRWFDRGSQTKIAVVSSAELSFDPAAALGAFLNASNPEGSTPFAVSSRASLDEAKASVERGDVSAALAIARGSSGDLAFTLVTKDIATQRIPQFLRLAATSLGTKDRLDRLGVTAAGQATLATPVSVELVPPTPPKPGEVPRAAIDVIAGALIGQVLVIFLFMAVILYGQWVAMSVAEEKSSRVMEIVLNAASPFELLGGKVLGVGGLGLVQYVAAFVPAVLALLFSDQIAALVLGGDAASWKLPEGLTPGVLGAFAVFFVLGFLLYAVLYAAAGSLVSRMEDVNNVVAPMSLLGVAGYLVAVYAASGLIPADAGWVVALSFFPLASPYLMLSRVIVGQAGLVDVAVASGILVVTIVGVLWLAARVYEAGVLMYGQRPSVRTMFRLAFRGR